MSYRETFTCDETTYSVRDCGYTSPCWLWTRAKHSRGYGIHGGRGYAHRLSYDLHYGPIPAGMCVCHKCDNPPCINPDHLFLGTHADNMRDAAAKGRTKLQQPNRPQPIGSQHGHAKLNESIVAEMRVLRTEGATFEPRAIRFGISLAGAFNATTGRTWRHV